MLHRSYYVSSLTLSTVSSGYLQLALALIFDLGLHKPLGEGEVLPGELVADLGKIPDRKKEMNRSPDERRVFLACYLFSSV
jgi:hypothetical protein